MLELGTAGSAITLIPAKKLKRREKKGEEDDEDASEIDSPRRLNARPININKFSQLIIQPS